LEAVQQITVSELVAMGRSPYQQFGWILREKDKNSIEWAIDYMNLGALRNKSLDKISGGERQRAWIAMILAQDTDIVLLDEPITFLDLKYQWCLLEIIRKIRSQFNKTFILVLHDINQAIAVADSFVVLKEGNIRAYGQAQDIITSHLLKDVYDVSAQICNFNSQAVVLPLER
ncbi:MAG TPA: ABC transporter ATP-binding protein, partial [Syntrophomonadaceae bacterium]|nr:ABC transporter ATP-binding protein [Syntrophomonadaceae bacterium]